jgi:hypothetical protein
MIEWYMNQTRMRVFWAGGEYRYIINDGKYSRMTADTLEEGIIKAYNYCEGERNEEL